MDSNTTKTYDETCSRERSKSSSENLGPTSQASLVPTKFFRKVKKCYKGESVNSIKKRVFEKYNYTCESCKINYLDRKRLLQLEHILPVALGGDELEDDNLVPCCFRCHRKKTIIDVKIINSLKKLGLLYKISNFEWWTNLTKEEIKNIYFIIFNFIIKVEKIKTEEDIID